MSKEVNQIMKKFEMFTYGTNVLFLMHRTKDGGHNKEMKRRVLWYIVHNREEYKKALTRLLAMKNASNIDYRIYASVNPRDLSKAEKEFKRLMLEADFAGKENKRYFYERLDAKWISALMKPGCKAKSRFLWDIDGDEHVMDKALDKLKNWNIIRIYDTKNGYHIITEPQDPTGIDLELKKDGLLLLSY